LAALTSKDESCRKRVIEKKKVLDELMFVIKSDNVRVKVAALQLFVSLSRSDKMVKAIILEHADY
jgi:phosphate uptake regulator